MTEIRADSGCSQRMKRIFGASRKDGPSSSGLAEPQGCPDIS